MARSSRYSRYGVDHERERKDTTPDPTSNSELRRWFKRFINFGVVVRGGRWTPGQAYEAKTDYGVYKVRARGPHWYEHHHFPWSKEVKYEKPEKDFYRTIRRNDRGKKHQTKPGGRR